jgi:glutamate/aspartate transport system substrate-binding protein
VPQDARFSAVTSAKADMECGATTMTLSRLRLVDFSSVVFVGSTGVVVGRAAGIRALSDMAGKKIAVVPGTSNEGALKEQVEARKLDIAIVPVKAVDEAMAALASGAIDGYASDKLLLMGARMKAPADLVMLPDDLSVEPYAIVLPRGDWALRAAVNTALAEIYRRGDGAALFRRWFEPVGLPLDLLTGAAFRLGTLAD